MALRIAGVDLYQLGRFGLVGGLTALIYFVLYVLLGRFPSLAPAVAAVIAYLVAITFQFFGHSRFTFGRPDSGLPEVRRFLILNGIGLAFAISMSWLMNSVLDLPHWAAALVVTLVLPVVNFIVMRLWVFA